MIFPPAFLDASNWSNNHGQQQDHHPSSISPSVLGGGAGDDGGGCGSHEIHDLLQASAEPGTLAAGGGGAPGAAAAKPMSMTERARMARIPQPEAGLKCPRCESTNTKFCYFNNYSLSQPRHFCRACRRYWTRGGALRNVPVGGGYRRHARRAKPKATPASASSTAPALASASTSTCTTGILATLPAMLSNGASILPPYLHRIADFDAMSLGSTLPGAGRPFTDTAVGCYSIGGGSAGLELMQSFPFLLAMNQTAPPAPAMAVPGMFHLGLDDSTAGGGGDGGGKLDLMPMRREGYPRERMYGDPSSGYDSYSSTAGN